MSTRPFRRHLLWISTGIFLCSCAAPSHKPAAGPSQDSQLQAAISRIKWTDPGSPAVLRAQLDYVEFLLNGDPGTCTQRLQRARDQLNNVSSSVKVRVIYPEGWASVADMEYRLHAARAECSGEPDRSGELGRAVAAAQQASELYRNIFDYRSMVIMQFDMSVALHELGENAAAIGNLEAVIDTDREYGFKDDGLDNYKLLLTWRGEPSGNTQVAALMQDFPQRQATLKFGWHASDAHITVESQRSCLVEGQTVSSRAAAAFEQHIAAGDDDGWKVSYSNRLTQYEPGVWPIMQGTHIQPRAFPPALLMGLGFKVSALGEFDGVTESKAFAPQLVARTEHLIRLAAPSSDNARSVMKAAVEKAPTDLSQGMLEAATAQDYQLQTAMWIGATLDQGVWYKLDAPLALPGLPQVVAQNHVEFAFTRMVPCTADSTEHDCVEIVMHAEPDKDALKRVVTDYNNQSDDSSIDHYMASINTRVVADPATLRPFSRENRIYWYASADKRNMVLQSEHLLSTTRYSGD